MRKRFLSEVVTILGYFLFETWRQLLWKVIASNPSSDKRDDGTAKSTPSPPG